MIQGYPDQSSVFPGDTITFHVSTDTPQFRIDVYRQGSTLAAVQTSDWMQGVFADDHDPDQDWGVAATRRDGKQVAGWPSYPLTVAPDWPTGIYIAMLIEGDGQGNPNPNQNPPLDISTPDGRTGKALFVVKNPSPGVASQVLYKLPLLTYQMYNYQGGGSAYQGFWVTTHRPGGGTGGTPWDVLIFQPPNWDVFDPPPALGGSGSPRQTFAHWDAKFIAWLEAQNFRIDYCTDLDVHNDDPSLTLLSPYALVLSVGHDEYYTQTMRDRLSAYIAQGGNVAFFSGNICYHRTRLPYEDQGNQSIIIRDPPWVDLGLTPEDAVTGVGFRNGGERNWPVGQKQNERVGYRVQHTNLWPFEDDNHPLGDGETFGLDECIVGYECDGTPFDKNSGNPLFNPADQTPPGFVILGFGDTSSWGGTGTATMGLYTQSGTVFNAATTDWPRVVAAGEAHAVQITLNVLNRLGGNPKGLATLAQLSQAVACDGFFTPDDNYRHAIVGTRGGEITELFFNPQTGQGQALLTTRNGLLDLGAFYSDDDRYRHVIAATGDGNVWEVFYNPNTGLGQTVLRNIPNVTRVCGFFTPDDNYRHAIAATSDGRVYEIFFNPQAGLGTALLGTFQDIVDIGGFYSPDDQYRHVLVGTADGTVTEIYYSPSHGTFQTVIATVPDLTRVSAYYAADDRFFNRRVQVLTRGGRIHEIRYHLDFGIMRAVLFNLGGVLDLGGFFSPDDNYRHAILASQTGAIQELFFRP